MHQTVTINVDVIRPSRPILYHHVKCTVPLYIDNALVYCYFLTVTEYSSLLCEGKLTHTNDGIMNMPDDEFTTRPTRCI